jgi:cbb3-type cytochrome oxidase maturation protein
VIFIVLPLAIGVAGVALATFFWAASRVQFDDLDTPSYRAIFDDTPTAAKPLPPASRRRLSCNQASGRGYRRPRRPRPGRDAASGAQPLHCCRAEPAPRMLDFLRLTGGNRWLAYELHIGEPPGSRSGHWFARVNRCGD